jgi:hypothetical protein
LGRSKDEDEIEQEQAKLSAQINKKWKQKYEQVL